MGYDGGGVNGALRWKDLALEVLMPVNEEKEEAKRAVEARKMASGAGSSRGDSPTPAGLVDPTAGMDEDDGDDGSDDENDENTNEEDTTEEEDGDEEEEDEEGDED